MKSLSAVNIKRAVRKRYAEIAAVGNSTRCCAPSPATTMEADVASSQFKGCCTTAQQSVSSLQPIEKSDYSIEEQSAAPQGANLGLGCGNPTAIAGLKTGDRVLDLGSGGGFDCFIASRKVGDSGHVIGVDMTAEMIELARKNAASMKSGNVEFRLGEIEHLPVADGSIDVILSNCVINLSTDKQLVFQEAFRVLKPGGRLAISDIIQTGPMPEELSRDINAITGCVGGAAPIEELRMYLHNAGFDEIRIEPRPGSGPYVASATIEAVKPKK